MTKNANRAEDILTKEDWAEITAALKEQGAIRRERCAAAVLDPAKEFTGKFDSCCNPIYNGSILAVHSGWEGYWTVFKNEAGEWLTRSIATPGGEPNVWPLSQNLGHSEVVENAEEHMEKQITEYASGGQCGECEYRTLCDQEDFARCRACEGKE